MIDFEYKVVNSRKGPIIFCKLDELLKKIYKVEDLGSLDQFKSNYKDQYICNCPFCKEEGHTKKKLYILPNTPGEDDFTTGYCFVCGRTYVHVTSKVDVNFKTPDFLKLGKKFEIIGFPEDAMWNLDTFNNEFDFYSRRGVEYLEKRNPYLHDLWKPLGFKFYGDNVVMPFFGPTGDPIYYQIRFIDAKQKDDIRYFFPPIKAKPPYILAPGLTDDRFIIVEGVYDAIAAMIQSGGEYNVIAVLGSHISDYQINYIREFCMPKKILVWMDETSISMGIVQALKPILNYADISIIPSSGADPEEVLNHRLRHGLKIHWITPEYGKRTSKYFPKFKLRL